MSKKMSWKRDNETNSKQSAVESLMYAQVWTQPDISYASIFLEGSVQIQ